MLSGAVIAAAWTMVWLGSTDGSAVRAFPVILLVDGSLAGLWLAAAVGYGLLSLRLTGVCSRLRRTEVPWLAGAIGVALLCGVNNALASLGWLSGLSVVLIVGGVVAFMAAMRSQGGGFRWPCKDGDEGSKSGRALALMVLPVGALLAAAASTPGWLWPTEFGGYDALSYHLQLPREWLAHGRLEPLATNAYSFLPSWIEGAFLHLMALRSGEATATEAAWAASTSCQFLVAGITILASGAVAVSAACLAGDRCAGVARALFLSTPWVIVTGSMAYTECGVLLGCAGAIAWCGVALRWCGEGEQTARALSGHSRPREWRAMTICAAAAGLCVALALGSKLSSAALVALPLLPLAMLVVIRSPAASRWRVIGAAGAAVIVPLLPWLLRNGLSIGNPVFPFAVGVLGSGSEVTPLRWSEAACERFAAAHMAVVSPWGHIGLVWDQWIRFGLGTPPDADPWLPQWGVLPWLALAGSAACLLRPVRHAAPLLGFLAVALVMQVSLWMAATHMQSRFLLPTAVTGAVLGSFLVALAVQPPPCDAGSVPRRRLGPALARGALVLVSAMPAALLLSVRVPVGNDDALALGPLDFLGAERAATGDLVAEALKAEGAGADEWRSVVEVSPAPFLMNHLVPPGTRVLCVGEAAPFWCRGPVEYSTVWTGAGVIDVATDEMPTPDQWVLALRERGVGAVYVDDIMLRRWRAAGWLAPHLTPESLEALLDRLTLVARGRAGRLFVVEPGPAIDPHRRGAGAR